MVIQMDKARSCTCSLLRISDTGVGYDVYGVCIDYKAEGSGIEPDYTV